MDYNYDLQAAAKQQAAGMASQLGRARDYEANQATTPPPTLTNRANMLIQLLAQLQDIQGNSRRILHGSYPEANLSEKIDKEREPSLADILDSACRLAESALNNARIIMEKL